MIEVVVITGKKFSLTLKGHAGSADIGEDLVCASASILAYTLAQNVKDNKMGCESIKVRLDKGDAEIACTPKAEYRTGIEIVYRAIVRGYELLQANFPDKISVRRGNLKQKIVSPT